MSWDIFHFVCLIKKGLGPDAIKICHLTSIGNTIVEIRRSYDRLISTMGFPIPVRWHIFYWIRALEYYGWCNKNMSSCQYRKHHCGDKTILRPSYLHNEISYTGKMTYIYWIRALEYYGWGIFKPSLDLLVTMKWGMTSHQINWSIKNLTIYIYE